MASVQDCQEFLRWWKSRVGQRNCFVLLVIPATADIKPFMAAGASDFLVRPYDKEALQIRLAVIDEHLKRRAQSEDSEETLRRGRSSRRPSPR